MPIGSATPWRPNCCAHGAVLAEISQVLRHRDLATTAVYAKVDHAALRELAPAWPVTR